MSTLVVYKCSASLVVFAFGLIGGFAPWWTARLRAGARWIGLGSAGAAGVLLGAGMIHLLADSAEGFRERSGGEGYPWAYLIACASFLGVLLIERVLPKTAKGPTGSRPVEDEVDAVLDTMADRRVYPYLLLVTLSLHSVMAGMALGAQNGTPNFLVVLIAIVAHKAVAGFALGVSLWRAGLARGAAAKLVFGFAAMTPLGILLGTSASAGLSEAGQKLFEVVFDGIAAGTFVYVASLDVIREEFLPPPPDRRAKWCCAAVGLGLMALLAVWT